MNKRHVVAHRQTKMFVYTKEISLERCDEKHSRQMYIKIWAIIRIYLME